MKRSPVAPWAALLVAALLLSGCATPPPAPGTARDAALQSWGAPTSRYTLPDGATRLEYATGPYGRMTWMIDLHAGVRVTQARQCSGLALQPALEPLAIVFHGRSRVGVGHCTHQF